MRPCPRSAHRRRAIAVAALLLATALQAHPALAQDARGEQVRRILQGMEQALGQRGYAMTHRISIGSLNRGAGEDVAVELDAGRRYMLLAACDLDCTNIDMVVTDAQGNEVGSDRLDDDSPVVNVTPPARGTYRVRMIMVTCSAEPCRFGVGVFSR